MVSQGLAGPQIDREAVLPLKNDMEERDTIFVEDILIGPVEAADYLKTISNRPLGVRTIASYTVMQRIPVLKSGSTTLFSKKMLEEWESAGRPNNAMRKLE